jgi:hypothetical protein
VDSFEHGNKTLGSTKAGKCHDYWAAFRVPWRILLQGNVLVNRTLIKCGNMESTNFSWPVKRLFLTFTNEKSLKSNKLFESQRQRRPPGYE